MNGLLSERAKCLLTGCVAAAVELIKRSLIHSVPPATTAAAAAAAFHYYSNDGGPPRLRAAATERRSRFELKSWKIKSVPWCYTEL